MAKKSKKEVIATEGEVTTTEVKVKADDHPDMKHLVIEFDLGDKTKLVILNKKVDTSKPKEKIFEEREEEIVYTILTNALYNMYFLSGKEIAELKVIEKDPNSIN